MCLPEFFEGSVVAAEDIALSFTNVGHTFRKRASRTEITFTIAGVLPEAPMIPWRGRARLVMIVIDP